MSIEIDALGCNAHALREVWLPLCLQMGNPYPAARGLLSGRNTYTRISISMRSNFWDL